MRDQAARVCALPSDSKASPGSGRINLATQFVVVGAGINCRIERTWIRDHLIISSKKTREAVAMGKRGFTRFPGVKRDLLLIVPMCISQFMFSAGTSAAETNTEAETGADDSLALLKMSLKQLQSIKITSATKTPQTDNEIPAVTRVVTARQIRERGYNSLEEALQDLPGIQGRDISGFNSYSFVRGAPSQNNLVLLLVDGVQINELNSGGFYGGRQHNLANVKRIEVVYGPASALYGTNALSGIINLVTFDPDDKAAQTSQISATSGSFDTQQVDFRVGRYDVDRSVGFTLSGVWKSTDKARLGGRAGDYNWPVGVDSSETDLAFDGKFQWRGFKAGFVFQDKDASNSTTFKMTSPAYASYRPQGSTWHMRFLNLWAEHDFKFGDTLTLNSKVYHRRADVVPDTIVYIDTATSQQSVWYRPNDLWGIEEKLSYTPNDRLNVVGGLVHEVEDLAEDYSKILVSVDANPLPSPPRPDSLTNRLSSLYAQVQYKVMPELILTVGGRMDESDYYGDSKNPRLGLVYNRNALTAKLIYSRAFRAPKPWDFYFGSGNTGLEPERMLSREVYLAWRFDSRWLADLSLFDNRIDNKLFKDLPANRWVNQGVLETRGLELSAKYVARDLRFYLNYSYTDSKDEQGVESNEISKHVYNTGFTYNFTDHVDVDLRANYLGKRKNPKTIPATGMNVIDDAMVLHTTVSYRDFHGVDFQLIVRNLFDAEYYHPSNLSPDRYRQPQRTILLKAQYAF